MLKNIYKHVSFEEHDVMVTENEEVAIKSAETIIQENEEKAKEQQQENEQILKQKESDIENIKEQAEEPFNPDKVEAEQSTDSEEGLDNDDQAVEDETQVEGESDPEADSQGDDGVGSETGEGTDELGDEEEASGEDDLDSGMDNDEDSSEEDSTEDGEDDSGESDDNDDIDIDSSDDSSDDDSVEDVSDSDDDVLDEDSEDDANVSNDNDGEDSPESEGEGSEDTDGDSDGDLSDSGTTDESTDVEEDNNEEESDGDDSTGDSDDDDSVTDDNVGSDDDSDGDVEDIEELEVEEVDLTTTDEDVEEAEAEAEEADEEAEEIEEEIIDDSKTLEELEKEEASVEEFIGLLKVAKQRGKFEPLFMASVSNKLEKLSKTLGPHSPSIPSLENYSDPNQAEGYYDYSLEAFEDIKKKLTSLKKNVNIAIVEKVRKWSSRKVEPKVEALNKKIDNIISRLVDQDNDFTIKTKFIKMDMGGKDPVKALAEDLKNTTKATNGLLKEQLQVQQKAVQTITKIGNSGGPKKTGKIVLEMASVKAKFNTDFKDYDFIQNFKLTEPKAIKGSNKGTYDKAYQVFSDIGVKFDNGNVNKSNTKKTFEINKSDLMKIMTLAKSNLALALKVKESYESKILEVSKFIGKDAVELLDKDFYKFEETWDKDTTILDAGDSQEELISAHNLLSQTRKLNDHSLQVMRFILSHTLFNADAICTYIGNRKF